MNLKILTKNRKFTFFVLILLLLVLPLSYYLIFGSITGYQAPTASFYSLDIVSKPFHYKTGDSLPGLGMDGVFTWQAKHFQFDYENYITDNQPDSLSNSPDIIGHMSVLEQDRRIDIPTRYGIDDSYYKEEVDTEGQIITTVIELQLWIYSFTVTFTAVPDGLEKVTHQARSWEPTTVLSAFDVGIELGYEQGIVSNANETYVLYLLTTTSGYETNDGDEIDCPVGDFNTFGKQEVDAILSPAATQINLEMNSIDDGSSIGANGESDVANYISAIKWMDASTFAKHENVYFQCGISKFQCAFFYTWASGGNWWSVGPICHLAPQAALTFDVHILVIGKFIFGVPYDELPEYNVDIDLGEEVETTPWFQDIITWIVIIAVVIVGLILVVGIIKARVGRTNIQIQLLKGGKS